MTATELLDALWARGIRLEPRGDTLRVMPKEALTDDLRQTIRENKPALLALLEPRRDTAPPECPSHWSHIPELPPKGEWATAGTPERPERYRVCLFGVWYIVRFEPNISETTVSVTCEKAKRRMFANFSEFYRWAWAEHYAPALHYREVN